ncbi:protein shisa-like-2A [Lycaon pictus]
MSGACTSYVSAARELVRGFRCPRPGGEAAAVFCRGFRDHKYCCDDPHSFFPYEHSYVWRLRYRPRHPTPALAAAPHSAPTCAGDPNSTPHRERSPGPHSREEGPPGCQGVSAGNWMEVPGTSTLEQNHPFLSPRLDGTEEQPVHSRRLLQHCFMARVTASDIPGSPEEAPVPNLDPCGPAP